MSQVDPDQNEQLLETLKNELFSCQTECNQTQLFLTEICNRLHSTQELINQYHLAAKIKGDRIAQLEQELELKSLQLEAVNFEHEELRKRIKSEKHNASQYKAALHRCLDVSELDGEEVKQIYNQAHILATSSSNEGSNSNQIAAVTSQNHYADITLQIDSHLDSTQFTQNLTSNKDPNQTGSHKLSGKLLKADALRRDEALISAQTGKDAFEDKPKSFAAIKLPQFAPLKPR